jgi:hypothetical protein
MQRRRRVALAVLGVGWLVWLGDLVARTPAADPKYVTPPEKYDAAVRKARQRGDIPARGTVGYRDEINPPTDDAVSRRNQLYLMSQYVVAPVLIDREGKHDLTLVVSPSAFYLERAGGKP